MPDTPVAARIGGQPAARAEAVARAAAILGASRCAVLGGLATDIAGIEAAVALARRIGGVLDHADAAAALRDLDLMRGRGWIVTTPLQARARADLLLLAGPSIAAAWPGFAARLALDAPPPLHPDRPRQVILLGADAETAAAVGPHATVRVDAFGADILTRLGVLRALVAKRPVHPDAVAPALARCAELVAEARYGVALWSCAGMDALAIDMLGGLVADLNHDGRFAGLPVGAGHGTVEGAVQATAWRTGFPPRVGFGRGHAEHDPWRFDGLRMIASGEADAVLWVGAEPPPAPGVPVVALVPDAAAIGTAPTVAIAVGEPGVDHDAVLHDADIGTLAARSATRPSDLPSTATVLAQILAALPC